MRTFSKIMMLALVAVCLVSCGKDDEPTPVDYTLTAAQVAELKGTYSGKVTFTNLKTKKTDVTTDATVRLFATSKSNVLGLETSESGLIQEQGDIFTNFKRTADDTAYTFDLATFTYSREDGDLPLFITEWYGSDYDTISEVKVTVSKVTAQPKYVKSTQTLTFEFDATVEYKAVYGTTESSETFTMHFKFDVAK